MKTKRSLIVIGAMAMILAFSSCGSQEKKSEPATTEQATEKTTEPTTDKATAEKVYQCPMKCEGEKTYSEPGTCPVCEMDLEAVSIIN